MARHLAPAGVDGDWESALASSAVGRKNETAGEAAPYAMKGSTSRVPVLELVLSLTTLQCRSRPQCKLLC